jgi:hypothetical protein
VTGVPEVIELGEGRVLLSGQATVAASRALRMAMDKARSNGAVIHRSVLELAAALARQEEVVATDAVRRARQEPSRGRQLPVREVQVLIGRTERTARRVAEQIGYQTGGRWFVDEVVLEEYLANR